MSQPAFQFRVSHLLVTTAFVAAVVSAAASCSTVYETQGYLASYFYPWALGFFVTMGLGCAAIRPLRHSAFIVMIVVCTGFSCRQAMLVQRLAALKAEVGRISDYLAEFSQKHGSVPFDLTGYHFSHPGLEQYIQYHPGTSGGYGGYTGPYYITFHPCTDTWLFPFGELGVYHVYSPGFGYAYEDD